MKQWQYDPKKSPMIRLSRSRVEMFLKCPRCFYLRTRLGVKEPSIPSFTLNNAVDALMKKEFDTHRAEGNPHPLMAHYGIEAIPFNHKDMDKWRENFDGVAYYDKNLNIEFCGAVDDIWQNSKGELYVVDYKATSTNRKIDLNDIYKRWYKKQIEFYQWLLRKNDFKVNSTAYFVYANGKNDKKAFDGKLEFDIEIIEHEGKTDWIEPTLKKMKETLVSNEIPESGKGVDDRGCELCAYRINAKKYE